MCGRLGRKGHVRTGGAETTECLRIAVVTGLTRLEVASILAAGEVGPKASDRIVGAQSVAEHYRHHANDFRPNGKSRFEVIHQSSTDNLGFWVGFQIATVQLKDQLKPTEMRIRITEVFCRDADGWKLIHRHADVPPP